MVLDVCVAWDEANGVESVDGEVVSLDFQVRRDSTRSNLISKHTVRGTGDKLCIRANV
jgi:hypothetical protein